MSELGIPLPLDGALDQVIANGRSAAFLGTDSTERGVRWHGIVDRLVRRFGKGAKPRARLALYRKCQLAVDTHGETAYAIISEVILASETAGRNKHLYFCKAVKLRLQENGCWPAPSDIDW